VKDFFDGTFWRFFGIGFFLTTIFILLNATFKFLRYWGSFILFALVFIYAVNYC
jgi:hypothetical protein